jgi:hypothetical protein
MEEALKENFDGLNVEDLGDNEFLRNEFEEVD